MIEMKMRIDDEIDLAGISVDRFEACADFFARLKADPEKSREALAEPSSGSPVSNNAVPLGCSIRKTGTGTVMSPSLPSIR